MDEINLNKIAALTGLFVALVELYYPKLSQEIEDFFRYLHKTLEETHSDIKDKPDVIDYQIKNNHFYLMIRSSAFYPLLIWFFFWRIYEQIEPTLLEKSWIFAIDMVSAFSHSFLMFFTFTAGIFFICKLIRPFSFLIIYPFGILLLSISNFIHVITIMGNGKGLSGLSLLIAIYGVVTM